MRLVRRKRDEAHLVVLEDSLETVGGQALFRKLSVDLGKDKLEAPVVVVAIEEAAEEYCTSECSNVHVIDCFTDPYGWNTEFLGSKHDGISLFSCDEGTNDDDKHVLLTKVYDDILTASKEHWDENESICILFAGISELIQNYGSRLVAHFLSKLRREDCIRSVCVHIHADLHTEMDMSLICSQASCVMTLEPAWGLLEASQSGGKGALGIEPYGKMVIRTRRSQGCRKKDILSYWIDRDGVTLEPWELPTMPAVKESLQDSRQEPHAMLSSMKLELSDQEMAAKTLVKLPYEHRGDGSRYQTNDYRDYLPPEAGGHGLSDKKLGHILYVRDSDSEEPDSDEDPDDDLDI